MRIIKIEKSEELLRYTSIEHTSVNAISKKALDILEKMIKRNWEKMSLEEQEKYVSLDMVDL